MTTATGSTTPPAVGYPDRPTIIYDGDCRFCRKQAERIRFRAAAGTFDYVPRQEPGLEDRLPQIRQGDFNSGMRLVHPDGAVSVGADAVYEIARRLTPHRYLAWLYRVPGLKQVCRGIYALIARNRMKLSRRCSDDSCAPS